MATKSQTKKTSYGQLFSTLIKKYVRTNENVGTIDKSFIQVNGLSSGYKDIQKYLKAVLLSMCGSAYSPHFENARRIEIMKQFVTIKIVSQINDNAPCLPCFKRNVEIFLV